MNNGSLVKTGSGLMKAALKWNLPAPSSSSSTPFLSSSAAVKPLPNAAP
jgi:hypothetical protein